MRPVILRSLLHLAGLALVLLIIVVPAASSPTAAPPTATWLLEQVDALTATEMEGRRSGTPGGDRAARRLAEALAALGLRPGGDRESFFQSFVIASGTRVAEPTALESDGAAPRSFAVGRDWMPHGGSPEADVTAAVVLAGHGVLAPEQGHDDYAGLDVRGRIVVADAGVPAVAADLRPSRLDKLIAARERGAAGLLLVEDTLPALAATSTHVDMPSASITRAAAAALTASPGARVRLRVALGRDERRAANVVGILPGTDPARAGEAIVIGAHYDHLGHVGGAIHPGADDNASGTAVALGLARAFAGAGGAPRTLVFALFGAEELGLLGSRHYVAEPSVPLARTVAMLNFDMVGRMRDDRIHVGGVDSGTTLRGLVADAARAEGLNLAAHGGPWAPSDHLRFYTAGAPVLFFHTGRHDDYHRPSDTADKLNGSGLARIAAMAMGLVERLAGEPRPQYVSLPPPARGRAADPAAAFFGVVADGRAGGDGVRVAGVVPGSAAARAGVAEGDVIVRFGGVPVETFAELHGAVRARRPGDRVFVVYLRDGRPRASEETLGARP